MVIAADQTSRTLFSSMSSSHVRFCTYNLLSDTLATPQQFTKAVPADLAADIREKRILTVLEEQIQSGAIIGLQEVSLRWTAALLPFFASRGYTFLPVTNGNLMNNFMGPALAFPHAQFEVLASDITRISDTRGKWPAPPVESSLLHRVYRWFVF